MTTDRLSSDTPTPGNGHDAPQAAAPAVTGTARVAASGSATGTAAGAAASAPQQQPFIRWISWGPGSSAAISIVCFVLILGAAIGFQPAGQKATAREEMPQQTTAPAPSTLREDPAVMRGDASAPAVAMPVATQSTATDPAIGTSLARARACAAESRWSCVLDAASGVLAIQEGNTEAQSLLQRAIVRGGWATETSSITHQTADAASDTVIPVPKPHVRRHHWHTAARSKPSDDDTDTTGTDTSDASSD